MAVVLIVEDDEQVRVLAESIIQDTGHETLTAANTDEALAIVDDSKGLIGIGGCKGLMSGVLDNGLGQDANLFVVLDNKHNCHDDPPRTGRVLELNILRVGRFRGLRSFAKSSRGTVAMRLRCNL